MTIEWLEEQLAKKIEEVEELKDVIHDLLPIDETDCCIHCLDKIPIEMVPGYHVGYQALFCLTHPIFDKARKVLGL
jgi:hypothetical protein